MKKLLITSLLMILTSCDYLAYFKTNDTEETEQLVASVGDSKLYVSDIEGIVPKKIALKDSLVFVKSYVTSWAKQQILLKKAEDNISEIEDIEINNLVQKYRQSLYITDYKERLIKQQLDTVVDDSEIDGYYEKNKQNFRLNEDVFKLKYIILGKDFVDKKEIIKKFKSKKEEDLEGLELNILNYKDYRLNDDSWISYEEVLMKIPPFRKEKKDNLLKKTNFIQKEDSLGVYLVAVTEFLRRNDVAPLPYVSSKIRALIIHKRKIELIRDIEKTLINDAIKNNTFKEYD